MNLYIARDKNKSLHLYGFKPIRCTDTWYDWNEGDMYGIIELDSQMFPNITWEHDPIEISIVPTEALQSLYKLFNKYKNYNNIIDK